MKIVYEYKACYIDILNVYHSKKIRRSLFNFESNPDTKPKQDNGQATLSPTRHISEITSNKNGAH